MHTFDEQSHPIGIIAKIASLGGPGTSFEFSKYRYQPRAIDDERRTYRVPHEEVREWLTQTAASLRPEEDLAFHSRVYLKNERLRHIPMIDLLGKPSADELKRIEDALKAFQINETIFYDSGRSLHLYGLTLITHEDWLQFLGRILLLNLPDEREVVDSRWVGHRLMAGYGTLRWTKNNSHYMAMPARVAGEKLE